VNHRIFERTLRPLVSRGACLFERHFTTQAWLGVGRRPLLGTRLETLGGVAPALSVAESFALKVGAPSAGRPTRKVDLGSGRDTR
jgi:hypothetical protein